MSGQRTTTRELYDRLSSAATSGEFPVFATFRTPRPAQRGPLVRYDPQRGQDQAEAIAASLSAEGLSAIVCQSFNPASTPEGPQRRIITPY